jgi:hypothetical protein
MSASIREWADDYYDGINIEETLDGFIELVYDAETDEWIPLEPEEADDE